MEFRKVLAPYTKIARALLMVAAAFVGVAFAAGDAEAASSRFCEGGGWVITQQNGVMLVRGRHVQFDIDLRTGGVRNWTLTGALNPGRLVERPTVIFTEKTPLHGASLTRTDRLRNDKGDLVFIRTNGVVTVKIQAKDCSQGGVFQMEIERDDAPSTRVRHTLSPEVFYYDNPNFRDREGDVVPFSNSAGETQNITITPRINFGSDTSANLVGRDSPQAATRVNHATCSNSIPKRDGTFATVRHCGGVTEWDVLDGGRMGQVMGEDATEVAPPATFCVEDCQAQNQVRGGAVVLGHPFTVPYAYRLNPRTP
ncbi:MAG TPA: hypothetical protein VGX48_21250 [Pyrinomonadaceae bacterium]|nr:hypothetical protein [Pyrinomonadaceae bacterium]